MRKVEELKVGFVAIIGAPNVGKSTFMNEVLKFKLAITSDKPQTTRHRLLGVHNEPGLQAIFIDTPGLHQAKRALNQRMVDVALAALQDVDLVLFMVEASAKGMAQGKEVAGILAKADKPVVLALNKIDLVSDKSGLLPFLEVASDWGDWAACIPISARTGDGASLVTGELKALLPKGEPLFPEDVITDLSERFLVSELIREKVFRLTGQEVPYSSAVTIDQFMEPEDDSRPIAISATIHVERDSQKGIIIGKRGAMIKRIGTEARKDMETLLGHPVFLDLFVRVEPKWSRSGKGLNKLGY
jgi:GTP-binding protein Era